MTGVAAAAGAAKAAAAKVKSAVGKDAAEQEHALERERQQQQQRKVASFHQELTETCVDILARYMFANPSVQPRRLPSTSFLLKEGNSATWLINTMLVTVTTSMCDQNVSRGGLCERCHLVCSKTAPFALTGKGAEDSDAGSADPRRRHQSEFHPQRPSPSRYKPGASAREDFDLRRQLSAEKIVKPPEATASASTKADAAAAKLETALNEQKGPEQRKPDPCGCWCTGWAEILVRRPAGNVSWMCRIQNASLVCATHVELPLVADLSSLLQPSRDPEVQAKMSGPHEVAAKSVPIEPGTGPGSEGLVTSEGQVLYSILIHERSFRGCLFLLGVIFHHGQTSFSKP